MGQAIQATTALPVQPQAAPVNAAPATPAAAGAPTASPNAAAIAAMTTRMDAATGFDAKNKIFHEYFDAMPDSEQAKKQEFFLHFMSHISKPDAERVMAFLAAVAKAEGEKAPAPAPVPVIEGTADHQKLSTLQPPTRSAAPAGVLMIGDSLSVGTDPYFGDEQTAQPTQVNAKSGRKLAEGMAIYEATPIKPRVVEMALFTNDTPDKIEDLRKALDKTVADARARNGRVVWATIVGSPKNGNYDAVNALIRDYAIRNSDVMGLVDWAKMTSSNPSFLGPDKYHGTVAGYQARAIAFANAARV